MLFSILENELSAELASYRLLANRKSKLWKAHQRKDFSMSVTESEVITALAGCVGSRHGAAEILTKVAEAGRCGCFPADVTCEELGQALERICLNAPDSNPFELVVRGWCKAAEARTNRSKGH